MSSVKHGFTLLELLIVISIIAVLLGISASAFISARATSRDSKRKIDLEQIRGALELFKADKGAYPNVANGGGDSGNVATALSILVTPTVYMGKLPTDPGGLNYYYYQYISAASGYALCTKLEHLPNGAASVVNYCTGAAQCVEKCNYEVTNP